MPRLNRLLIAGCFLAALAFSGCGRGPTCGDGTPEGEAKCPAALCGNGRVEGTEQCDDGNTADGDGCSSTCTKTTSPAVCGDGVIEGGEACDDGAQNGTSGDPCASDCTLLLPPEPICGNGKVETGEACDDGNTDDGDACEHDCVKAFCGNTIVDWGEKCDDGNTSDGDFCEHDCTNAICGNGILDKYEDCDDGNGVSGDGCENDCTVTGSEICGNGTIEGNELCDDGAANGSPGDGCEADCTPTTAQTVTCAGASLPPLTDGGTCEVVGGDGNRLYTGTVLAPGKIYEGGQVLVSDAGVIACVACDCAGAPGGGTATRVTCPGAVISPGLINLHDHITYQDPPYVSDAGTNERYEHRNDWRTGENGHTEIRNGGSRQGDPVRWGELRQVMAGETSVTGSGGADGLLRNLDKPSTGTGANQEGLGEDYADFVTFPLGDSSGVELVGSCFYPSTPYIPYKGVYEPHVAEGINRAARNEFLCEDGLTSDWSSVITERTAILHGVGLRGGDIGRVALAGAGLVWAPRSNIALYGDTASVLEYYRLGVPIALGTDWLQSGSMNLLRELKCADGFNQSYLNGTLTDRFLWKAVTSSAADIVHMADKIGRLAPGKVADLSIFHPEDSTQDAYRAVIDANPPDVVLTVRGGKVLYGDTPLVNALVPDGTTACNFIDVCGIPKSACLSSEINETFGELSNAESSAYPLFFCGTKGTPSSWTPTDEPTCTPERDAMWVKNGSTPYSGVPDGTDTDGDGIPDGSDDCPFTFNPIRPEDNNPLLVSEGATPTQSDVDGDGVGDACDACPLTPGTVRGESQTCTPPNPDDADGDSVADAQDNCPDTPNLDQEDTDQDGVGDACDACSVSNPNGASCPVSLYDITTPDAYGQYLYMGVRVMLAGVVVTGVIPNSGFFVQVPTSDPGYTGPDHSGLFVYTNKDLIPVTPGDLVNIDSGYPQEFYGQLELGSVHSNYIHKIGRAAIPDPVPVAASDVGDGGPRAKALESVLVEVQNATVTAVDPANGEFTLSDGLGGPIATNALYTIDPFPIVGETLTSLTGIHDFRGSHNRIEPRSAADAVFGPPIIAAFGPPTFTRVGHSGDAFPQPLLVSIPRKQTQDTTVAVSSGSGDLTLDGGGVVTIPAGALSASVQVTGVTQDPGVTLTATLNGTQAQAQVRVLGTTETATLASLTPSTLRILPGASGTFTVSTDVPPAADTVVNLSITPATGFGTIPTTVTIPADQLSATFEVTLDPAAVGGATLTATLGSTSVTAIAQAIRHDLVINEVDYDQPESGDPNEFVEVYNATDQTISLANTALVLINGSATSMKEYARYALDGLGSLGPHQYLVVGTTNLALPGGCLALQSLGTGNNIQNGSPDAVALIDTTYDLLIDSFSYEGGITAATLADGTTLDFLEGTKDTADLADSNSDEGSLARLPDGTDTDSNADDFRFTSTPTPCAANQ